MLPHRVLQITAGNFILSLGGEQGYEEERDNGSEKAGSPENREEQAQYNY